MGISVQEILAVDYFRDFIVVAGRKGLHKDVQGVATMDAPDCFKWAKGREMVLSSGYVISQNPDCIKNAFESGDIQKISAMIIKRQRYLSEIPPQIIELFNANAIPLITAPFSASWMDITNNINTAVMNRSIQRFKREQLLIRPRTLSYKENQIRRLLKSIEAELDFPTYLFDIKEEKAYTGSGYFEKVISSLNLKNVNFRDPDVPYTKHVLCEYIQMVRIRLINSPDIQAAPISWVYVPITIDGVMQAYLVVMESRELLDYYDEYSIRIAYLMLQSLYEQLHEAQNSSILGFENYLHYALSASPGDSLLAIKAAELGISMVSDFYYIMFSMKNEDSDVSEKEAVIRAFYACELEKNGRIAFLDNRSGLILTEKTYLNFAQVQTCLEEFLKAVRKQSPDTDMVFGVCMEPKPVREARDCIDRCRRIIKMGALVYPDRHIWDYEMLGPLAWIDIPKAELDSMLSRFRKLTSTEQGLELIKTLKCYLECNMNFSAAAEQLYVHINTVRKRIDKLTDIFGTDWTDHVEQMKYRILLQFLDL